MTDATHSAEEIPAARVDYAQLERAAWAKVEATIAEFADVIVATSGKPYPKDRPAIHGPMGSQLIGAIRMWGHAYKNAERGR